MGLDIGLFNAVHLGWVRKFRRVGHFQHVPVSGMDMVDYRRCGHNQVNVKFPLQALLDHIHVKQAQESAAETKAQGLGGFRFKLETGIIELQFFQGFTEVIVLVGFNGVETGKNHRIHLLIASQGFGSWIVSQGDGITHSGISNSLDGGRNVANISSRQDIPTNGLRRENPDFGHIKGLAIGHHLDGIARLDHPIDNPNLENNSPIRVVNGVKNQSL